MATRLTTFDDLPMDMLEVIAGKVAADSHEDLVNLKLISKNLKKAGESYQVFMHANLDAFEISPWQNPSEEEVQFLADCLSWNNPNAYFRLGMQSFFGLEELEEGFSYLYTAYLMGQKEAGLAAGLIMLGFGDDWHLHGLILLNCLKNENPDWNVAQSMYTVDNRLKEMWVDEHVFPHQFVNHCPEPSHTLDRIRDMDHYEDEQMEACWYCSWYRQYMLFSRMLNEYL